MSEEHPICEACGKPAEYFHGCCNECIVLYKKQHDNVTFHEWAIKNKARFISPEAKADATVETPMVSMATEMRCEKCGFKCDSRGANHATGWKLWCDQCKRDARPVTGSGTNWDHAKDAAAYLANPISVAPIFAVDQIREIEEMKFPNGSYVWLKKRGGVQLPKDFNDPTRAAVELEMSEVQIRKYKELKRAVWAHGRGSMQRSYTAWPTCAEHGPKKLQVELFGGKILPAFACGCGVTFVKPYGAPVDIVRRHAALGSPTVVCTEEDGR